MVGVGVWLITLDGTRRAVPVLGLFLILRGFVNANTSYPLLLREIAGGAPVAAWIESYGVGFIVAMPFLVAVFASLYPRPRGPLGRSVTAQHATLGLGLAAVALAILEPGLAVMEPVRGVVPQWLIDAHPLLFLRSLFVASYAFAGLLFIRDYAYEPAVADRPALLLVATGFLYDAVYLGVRDLTQLLDASLAWDPITASQLLALPPAVLALGLLVTYLPRARTAEDRRPVLWTIAGVLTPALLGVLGAYRNAGLGAAGPTIGLLLDSLGVLALPVAVVYGVLRRELLGIDLTVKRSIRRATVAAAFLGVFLLASEFARLLAPDRSAQVVGLIAIGGLFLVYGRVREVGDQVAGAAMPEVEATHDYVDRRALELYRAALEESLVDGGLGEEDERRLAALRDRLGITRREHVAMQEALIAGEPEAASSNQLAPGRRLLDRYEIRSQLGEGGQGSTYLADDTELERPVVLKEIHGAGPQDVDGLVEEARRLAAIDAPTVVTVYDVLRTGEQVLLVMEYVRGGSLTDRLENGPLDPLSFHRVAQDAIDALEVVHDAGIIHRDLKPGNLLLSQRGGAKLADFGVATLAEDDPTAGPRQLEEITGTLRYMSPEQAKGQPVSPRSDLYSLAATLFEAYTGEAYLTREEGQTVAELQMRAAAPGPFDREVDGPPELERWFATALAPAPADRFASAGEMRAALDDALGTPRQPSPLRGEPARAEHAD